MATITYTRPHFDGPETITNPDADKIMNVAEIMLTLAGVTPNRRAAGPVAQNIAKAGGEHTLPGLDIEITMTIPELVECVTMHEMRYANA